MSIQKKSKYEKKGISVMEESVSEETTVDVHASVESVGITFTDQLLG